MGLRLKLTLPHLLVWCVLFIIFNYFWLPPFLSKGLAQYREQQQNVLQVLAYGLLEPVLRGDLAQIYATLDKVVAAHQDWVQLTIWDSNNNLLYPLDKPESVPSENYIDITHQQTYGGNLLLKMSLVADSYRMVLDQQARVNELRWLFFIVFLVAISFSIFIEERVIRRPITQLADAANRISEMDFSVKLPGAKKDEVGRLLKAFDLMRYNLQRHQEELRQARDQALEATRVKSEFLATMSHELRTPLNAIIGYCELMEDELIGRLPGSDVDDLKKIKNAGHHLLTLINDILDLAKIEAGKMELNIDRFSLNTLIVEVVDTIRPLAEKNANTLRMDLSPQVDLVVGDRVKVKQVLFNLLSNACKFTSHGSIDITVSAVIYSGQNFFKVNVSDNGVGIEKDKLNMLFEAFTQLDGSYNRKFDGTGLGLALSRQLCHMMEGDIEVQSTLDQGSTFSFWLPAQLARQQAA